MNKMGEDGVGGFGDWIGDVFYNANTGGSNTIRILATVLFNASMLVYSGGVSPAYFTPSHAQT